jgi:hypothetical protein
MPETTRRGFLGLIAGAVALPFVPRPDEPVMPLAVTDSFVGYNHPTSITAGEIVTISMDGNNPPTWFHPVSGTVLTDWSYTGSYTNYTYETT